MGLNAMRLDLLNLTIDDLITLSNRGLVKRAQQEIQGNLTGEIQDDGAGNLQVDWSDGVQCRLPAQATLSQSHCTCPATSLCRHLLRSVLRYQDQARQAQSSQAPAEQPQTEQPQAETSPTEIPTETPTETLTQTLTQRPAERPANSQTSTTAWNPGDISDETLRAHYSKAELTKLRSQFDQGQVIAVACRAKPTVHFHSLSLNLRFLVPQDLRYSHCDCNEAAPCRHVPLAIWAFRQLPTGQTQGLITTESQALEIPTALLDALEQQLQELARIGIAGMTGAPCDRLARLAQTCRQGGLVWIAEILLDVIQSIDQYHSHDAQFDIQQVLHHLSELAIRSDAIRNADRAKDRAKDHPNDRAIPQLWIRGSLQDQTTAIGSARLMGLGCGVTPGAAGVTLTAYLQDLDSGTVMAMPRYFPNPPAADPLAQPFQPQSPAQPSPPDFWCLAQQSVGKGLTLGAIGSGQLLIKGGKRSANAQLIPSRSPMSLTPQAYQWEKLRSPLRVESFEDLIDRLKELPLPELRPRRVTEGLQVLDIAEVQSVDFDPISQSVRAIVRDGAGLTATLVHPYCHRGRFGIEAMLTQLQSSALKFVSAQVSWDSQGLTLAPIALIFEGPAGDSRQILQPWIAAPSPGIPPTADRDIPSTSFDSSSFDSFSFDSLGHQSPIAIYLQDLAQALQSLWLLGLDRADAIHLRQWQQLVQQGRAIGFSQFLKPIGQLAAALEDKRHTLQWDSQPAAEALGIITVLSQLAKPIPNAKPL
jgi:hypothetical protein